MKIEYKFTLQRLSLSNAAQAVWNEEDIQNEVIKYFLTTKVLDKEEEWDIIIKKALRKIPPISLPSVLYCELLYAIKSTGIRICDWFFYLRNIKFFSHALSRQDYDKYLKKICWTYYGTIDEVQTLKYLWVNNPNLECWKVFDLASCFCAKDIIDKIWEKNNGNIHCAQNSHFYESYRLHVLAYWIHRQNSTLETFLSKIESHSGDGDLIYEIMYSVEENMLRMAVKSGHHLAVQYFWKGLNEEQRERNSVFCLRTALEEYEERSDNDTKIRQYVKDRNIEICIFLFNNVTDGTKRKVFEQEYWSDGTTKLNTKMRTFVKIFMTSYPWQDFIIPIVMELKNKNYSSLNLYSMFSELITAQIISDNSNLGLPVENSVMQRQFCILWQIVPKRLKSSIAYSTFYKLLDLWNLKLIKCVLYDKDLKQQRMSLLMDSYEKCKYFSDNGECGEYGDMIDEFIDNLLIFDDWDDYVKLTMKKLYRLLKNFNLNEANELLFFENASKDMIDHALLTYYFIKNGLLDQADKFLWWKFDYSNVSVRGFRRKFMDNTQFSRFYIYSLWVNEANESNFLTAEKLSTKFIHCFLDLNRRDEIVTFVNGILFYLKAFNFSEMQTFFISKNKFKALNKFLNWCANILNKIVFNKEEYVRQGFIDKMCKRYIEENDLHSAEQLLKWAFPTEEKLLNFKHSFITSSKGTEVLKYYIATANVNETNPELRKSKLILKFKTFVNFWIKPLKDFTEIVKTLNTWNETVAARYHDDLFDIDELNLDLAESESVITGFRQYKRCRKHLFWDTKNYNLFMNVLGCSHCHFIKSLNDCSDDLYDD